MDTFLLKIFLFLVRRHRHMTLCQFQDWGRISGSQITVATSLTKELNISKEEWGPLLQTATRHHWGGLKKWKCWVSTGNISHSLRSSVLFGVWVQKSQTTGRLRWGGARRYTRPSVLTAATTFFQSRILYARTHARHTGSLLTRVVSKWPRESLGLFQAKTLILGGRQITPQTPSTTAVRTSHSFKHSKKTSSHLQRPTHRGTVRLALQWRWIGGRVIS